MRKRLLLGAAALGLVVVASLDRPAAQIAADDVRIRLAEIYGGVEEAGLLAVDAALDPAIQAGLVTWLGTLPLEPEVRDRVAARVQSGVVVDEVVPFLWFLKGLYDHGGAVSGFDAHLRARADRPASWEHALFAWAPPADEGGGGGLPDPEVLARLVTLYDAAWLRDQPADTPLAQSLRCGQDDPERLRARSAAAAPVIKDLLGALKLEGDPGLAVERVRSDEAVLRTVSTSLVEFVDQQVCKHYAVFARERRRERQLRQFLDAAIDRGDPVAWEWATSFPRRRAAVHVIVDGLQGGLVRALGTQDAAAFARIRAEHEVPAPSVPSVAGPAMDLDWLDAYARGEFPAAFPTFAALLGSSAVARQGVSTTPTISVRNLPLVMTGAPVAGDGGTGIPNFHFVDRTVPEGRPWYFYGNDALQLTRLTHDAGMRTLFDRLSAVDTMSCGSQYDELAGWSFDGFLNLAVGEHRRDFGESLCLSELEARARNEVALREKLAVFNALRPVLTTRHRPWELYDLAVQREARKNAHALAAQMATLATHALPTYLQWYNPWPDHFAHGYGPYSDAIVGPAGEYARLDHWLGRVQAVYAGTDLQVRYGMAGDHGLGPVRWIVSPEAVVFDALRAGGVPLVVRKISSDEGEGPKLTDRFAPPSMRGVDAVVASTAGGNYMVDLFVDQGDGWARQPVVDELRRWRTLGGDEVDIVDELARRLGDSLDYLAVRRTPCSPRACELELWRYRGGKREVMVIRREDMAIGTTGVDFFGDSRALGTEEDWATLHGADGRRPQAVLQLSHLYDTDRAGTINLFPVAGVGYNTKVPGRHAGESFPEKDAFVGLWGAGIPAGEGPAVLQNGQVAASLYAWLTGETPHAGEDGWGFETWDGRPLWSLRPR